MDSGLRRNDEVKNLEPSSECQHNLATSQFLLSYNLYGLLCPWPLLKGVSA